MKKSVLIIITVAILLLVFNAVRINRYQNEYCMPFNLQKDTTINLQDFKKCNYDKLRLSNKSGVDATLTGIVTTTNTGNEAVESFEEIILKDGQVMHVERDKYNQLGLPDPDHNNPDYIEVILEKD